jgi:hypothetical protein
MATGQIKTFSIVAAAIECYNEIEKVLPFRLVSREVKRYADKTICGLVLRAVRSDEKPEDYSLPMGQLLMRLNHWSEEVVSAQEEDEPEDVVEFPELTGTISASEIIESSYSWSIRFLPTRTLAVPCVPSQCLDLKISSMEISDEEVTEFAYSIHLDDGDGFQDLRERLSVDAIALNVKNQVGIIEKRLTSGTTIRYNVKRARMTETVEELSLVYQKKIGSMRWFKKAVAMQTSPISVLQVLHLDVPVGLVLRAVPDWVREKLSDCEYDCGFSRQYGDDPNDSDYDWRQIDSD